MLNMYIYYCSDIQESKVLPASHISSESKFEYLVFFYKQSSLIEVIVMNKKWITNKILMYFFFALATYIFDKYRI